jgi:hypothetical protein
MNFRSVLLKSVFAVFALGLSYQIHAQSHGLPGEVVDVETIDPMILEVVQMAEDVFPEICSCPNDWRSYEGFVYKYYTDSDFYFGFSDDGVYLLAGPDNIDLTYYNTIETTRSELTILHALVNNAGPGVDIVAIFDLIEELFPVEFANPSGWLFQDSFIYQYSTTTGIHVGVSDGGVYLLGGPFGNEPVFYADVATTLAQLQAMADG